MLKLGKVSLILDLTEHLNLGDSALHNAEFSLSRKFQAIMEKIYEEVKKVLIKLDY